MARPDLNRVPEWYHGYISKTTGDDVVRLLDEQISVVTGFMTSIPAEKHDYRYAEGKWSLRDLFQHLLDAERIFAYRALRFARKDPAPLPWFEENDYVTEARASRRNWEEMIGEFTLIRKSNVILFRSFDETEMEREGIASGKSIYVRAIGFIMVGHIYHHIDIIRERYLQAPKEKEA